MVDFSVPARIYVLGPEGTFSERAARRLAALQGRNAPVPLVYTPTIVEALQRTAQDPDACAVVPVENSESGMVVDAQDALAELPLHLSLELRVSVRYSLLGNCGLRGAGHLFSHPLAQQQCSRFVASSLPGVPITFTNSNSHSARCVLEHGSLERAVAIVPADLAAAHSELVRATDIQNSATNTTRFVVASLRSEVTVPDYSKAKTSLVIAPPEDEPGLLVKLLEVFAEYGINLCRIESRPGKLKPWNYRFFLDVSNNEHSAAAVERLVEIEHSTRVMGTYDIVDVD